MMPKYPRPTASQSTLRGIVLLRGLPEAALQQLGAACVFREFSPDQRIVSRGSEPRHVHFIVRGKVRVALYSPDGIEVAYRDVAAGGCFGEISAIDGAPRSANVVALEPSLVAQMPANVFRELLEQHALVMHRVVLLLTATIRSLSDRLFELSTLGVPNRVHAEILRLAREAGIKNNVAVISPAPKHADIAARVATNREQVTKVISAMVKQGLLERAVRALVVTDVVRLERLVSGESR